MTTLRDAGQMIGPTLDALDVPDADKPLLALVRRMAATIDAMPDAMAGTMLPNHAGPVLRALGELEDRARRRRERERPKRANPVVALRSASAQADVKRKGRAG